MVPQTYQQRGVVLQERAAPRVALRGRQPSDVTAPSLRAADHAGRPRPLRQNPRRRTGERRRSITRSGLRRAGPVNGRPLRCAGRATRKDATTLGDSWAAEEPPACCHGLSDGDPKPLGSRTRGEPLQTDASPERYAACTSAYRSRPGTPSVRVAPPLASAAHALAPERMATKHSQQAADPTPRARLDASAPLSAPRRGVHRYPGLGSTERHSPQSACARQPPSPCA